MRDPAALRDGRATRPHAASLLDRRRFRPSTDPTTYDRQVGVCECIQLACGSRASHIDYSCQLFTKARFMPSRFIHRISIVIVLCGIAAAQPTQAAEVTRRQAFQTIQGEYSRKLAAFNKASEGIRNNADAAKVAKLKPSAAEYCKRFLALAKEKPEDDVALDSLVWIVENDDPEDPFTQLEDVLNLIEKHHLASPR